MAHQIECKLDVAPEKMVRTPFRLPKYIPSVILGIKGKTKQIVVKQSDLMKALKSKGRYVFLKIKDRFVPATISRVQTEKMSIIPSHITFETLVNTKNI